MNLFHAGKASTMATLAAILLVAPACSARKIVYGYIDRVAYRAVDSAFDVTTAQKAFLKDRLNALHAWHAREELPRYVATLEELETRASDGTFDKADADWFYDRLEEAKTRLVDEALPDAVRFLSTLEPRQVKRVEGKNAERTRARLERLDDGEKEFVEKRVDGLEGNFRPWLGSLSAAQIARVEAYAREAYAGDRARVEGARRSQLSFTGTLMGRPQDAEIAHLVRSGLRSLSPTRNAYQARLRDLVVEVAALADATQRAHFVKEVRAWRADFAELHRKYGSAVVGQAGAPRP